MPQVTTVSPFEILPHPRLLDFAKTHLKFQGKLYQKENGYLYLKIQDDFIHRLIQFVDDPKKEIPDYFEESNYSGAHISVVYPDELEKITSSDLNRSFDFSLKSYFKAQVLNKIYFGCTVNAPGLDKIRSHLGLSPLLNFKGYLVPFHFTIAVYELGK